METVSTGRQQQRMFTSNRVADPLNSANRGNIAIRQISEVKTSSQSPFKQHQNIGATMQGRAGPKAANTAAKQPPNKSHGKPISNFHSSQLNRKLRQGDSNRKIGVESTKRLARNQHSQSRSGQQQFTPARKFGGQNNDQYQSQSANRSAAPNSHQRMHETVDSQDYPTNSLRKRTQGINNSLSHVNSYTRLHKGESSVVRSYDERKALAQQQQQDQQSSRHQLPRQTETSAIALRSSQNIKNSRILNQIGQTSRMPNMLVESRNGSASQLYQSNLTGSQTQSESLIETLNQNDMSRKGGTNAGGNRSKGQKQPRQSKSIMNNNAVESTTTFIAPQQQNSNNFSLQNEQLQQPHEAYLPPTSTEDIETLAQAVSSLQDIIGGSPIISRQHVEHSNSHSFEPIGTPSDDDLNLNEKFKNDETEEAAQKSAIYNTFEFGQNKDLNKIDNAMFISQQPQVDQNQPSDAESFSGFQTALNFTKRLMDENDEQKNNLRIPRKEIHFASVVTEPITAQVSQSKSQQQNGPVQPENTSNIGGSKLEIRTQNSDSKQSLQLAQKFISPKFASTKQSNQNQKPSFSKTGVKFTTGNQQSSLVTQPVSKSNKCSTSGVEKKQVSTHVRGSSNTSGTAGSFPTVIPAAGNKPKLGAQNTVKTGGGHSLTQTTPVRCSNFTNSTYLQPSINFQQKRSSINHKEQSVTREVKNQRMFAPQHLVTQPYNNNQTQTSRTNASPMKHGADSGGPSYLKSTFSHSTKTVAKVNAAYSNQISRGRSIKNTVQLQNTQPQQQDLLQTQAQQTVNTDLSQIVTVNLVSSSQNQLAHKDNTNNDNQTSSKTLPQVSDNQYKKDNSPPNVTNPPPHTSTNRTTAIPQYYSGQKTSNMISSRKKRQNCGFSNTQPTAQNSNASQINRGLRGGLHHGGKAQVVSRDKRPQSKRGFTADKRQSVGTHFSTTKQAYDKKNEDKSQGAAKRLQIVDDQSLQQLKPQKLKNQSLNLSQTKDTSQTKSILRVDAKPQDNILQPTNQILDQKAVKQKSGTLGTGKTQSSANDSFMVHQEVEPNVSKIAAQFAAAPKSIIEHNYKRKQDQIVQMIQSNMKRSEDIQQSLSSGKFVYGPEKIEIPRPESCGSSTSNLSSHCDQSHQSITALMNEQSELSQSNLPQKSYSQEFSLETPAQVTLHNSVQKVPQTKLFKNSTNQLSPKKANTNSIQSSAETEKNSNSNLFINKQEQQLAISNSEKNPESSTNTMGAVPSSNTKMLFQKMQQNSDYIYRADDYVQEQDNVEDIFDDSECINMQKPLAEELVTNQAAIETIISKIEPPTLSSCNTPVAHDDKMIMSPPLPAKKIMLTQSSDDSLTVEVTAAQPFPFGQNSEVTPLIFSALEPQEQYYETSNRDDLTVVAEDFREDRPQNMNYDSLNQSQTKTSQNSRLPMARNDFVAAFNTVLTPFEKAELKTLELANDMIYYAGDILTRPNVAAARINEDDEDNYYVLKTKDQLLYRFEVVKVLGKGSFAQVVSAIDHFKGVLVAIKLNRNTEIDHKFAQQEGKLLRFLMREDPKDEHNIVRMIDHVRFRSHQCFVFELLNMDLFEHLKENQFQGFKENQIRSYAAQLLKALVFLEERHVIHCDLKPENILCVDRERMKLKVVDFGSGCLTHEQIYTYVQSRYYRAPEVILRIPYNEKVDIWSLGCILAELYTGEPLFPGNNEQEQLEYIMELQGMFPERMIDRSRKREYYFDTDYSPFLIEDPKYGILRIPESLTLKDAIPTRDRLFLDFIAHCLVLDPEDRPGASELIRHPWIRTHYFSETGDAVGGRKPYMKWDVAPQKPSQNQITDSACIEDSDEEIEVPIASAFDIPHNYNPEDVKLSQSTRSSRLRETAGARASACEVSPEKHYDAILGHNQRLAPFNASIREHEVPVYQSSKPKGQPASTLVGPTQKSSTSIPPQKQSIVAPSHKQTTSAPAQKPGGTQIAQKSAPTTKSGATDSQVKKPQQQAKNGCKQNQKAPSTLLEHYKNEKQNKQ